ncbi:hypothetical protein QE152_g24999 [Popillia japonica]|uniref:SEP domain-containing protein n=1 Tax=Popillia japonica TaxID=7064 RepID=A0AAW1K3M7_POPJA
MQELGKLSKILWDLELALTSFYDPDSEQPEVVHVESPRSEPDDATANNPAIKTKPKPRAKANSRFATLHALETSSSDEEGVVVRKEHGVEILDSATTSTARAFKGTDYKLGQTGNDSETIPGRTDPPTPTEVTMKLERDGFSVNDGPLRAYTDPTELRQGVHEVHLSMEDHRMEEFKQDHLIGAPLEEDKTVNEAHARQMANLDAALLTTSSQIQLAHGSRLIGQFNHNHTVRQTNTWESNDSASFHRIPRYKATFSDEEPRPTALFGSDFMLVNPISRI